MKVYHWAIDPSGDTISVATSHYSTCTRLFGTPPKGVLAYSLQMVCLARVSHSHSGMRFFLLHESSLGFYLYWLLNQFDSYRHPNCKSSTWILQRKRFPLEPGPSHLTCSMFFPCHWLPFDIGHETSFWRGNTAINGGDWFKKAYDQNPMFKSLQWPKPLNHWLMVASGCIYNNHIYELTITTCFLNKTWKHPLRIHVWNIYLHWDYFKLL